MSNMSKRYSVTTLQIFPVFATREDFKKAHGKEPPPFDPERAPKIWFDPAAATATRKNVTYTVLAQDEQGRPELDGGKPQLDTLSLKKEIAATVNIPPRGPGFSNVPGADVEEVPVPLRELVPGEELVMGPFGVEVINHNFKEELNDRSGFTSQDRDLLRAIAKKVGAA